MTDGCDGWTADVVFDGASTGYSYDDIIFMPDEKILKPSEVKLSTRLTKNMVLEIPLVGAPTDAATEAEMAQELALAGGVGFIHWNQSVKSQVEMVKRVKRFANGFIYEPVVLSPNHKVADVDKVKADYGFSGVPITEGGQIGGKIVGIVSGRDIDPIDDRSTPISKVMTKQVVLGREAMNLSEAYDLLQSKKVSKLPIVNDNMCLISMVSKTDLKRQVFLKGATRDSKGRLVVGAGVSPVDDADWDRVLAVIEAGADMIYVDTGGSKNSYELDFIRRLKEEYPSVDVLAGPVTACREAKFLCDAGVDAVVVGSSASSLEAGGECNNFGRPEATATFEVSRYVSLHYGIPTVSVGGLRNPGQILKALGLGANAVMLDDLLAAALEAPGGQLLRAGAIARLVRVPEPVPAVQPRDMRPGAEDLPKTKEESANVAMVGKGSVRTIAPYIASGLCNGLSDLGIASMPDLHKALMDGRLRMECRSFFGQKQAELRALDAQRSRQQYIQPLPA